MTPATGDTAPGTPAPARVQEGITELSTPTVSLVSELDAYILERQKSQPKTLEEVVAVTERRRARQGHRLVLPSYFEGQSYDNADKPGAYIFRWIFKEKRALDRALNVVGWLLVNRTYFPDAPKHLFTANGGVEEGDLILMFMPAKKALEIRQKPGELSQERIKSQMTPSGDDPSFVMMTGHPDNPKYYKPELSKDEESGVPAVASDF